MFLAVGISVAEGSSPNLRRYWSYLDESHDERSRSHGRNAEDFNALEQAP